MPEADGEAAVAITLREVGGQRDPAASLRAPEPKLKHAHLDADGRVQASADADKAAWLPVAAATHAQPTGQPFVFDAAAHGHRRMTSRPLQLVLAEALEAECVVRRAGNDHVGG